MFFVGHNFFPLKKMVVHYYLKNAHGVEQVIDFCLGNNLELEMHSSYSGMLDNCKENDVFIGFVTTCVEMEEEPCSLLACLRWLFRFPSPKPRNLVLDNLTFCRKIVGPDAIVPVLKCNKDYTGPFPVCVAARLPTGKQGFAEDDDPATALLVE